MSRASNRGFTLIELMLAMTFISVLLVAIAMTTIQITNIYTKGITLREVNQAGRSITDDLQRSISASVPFDATPRVDNSPATATSKYVVRDGGGRLCLGNYTYAWNFGKALVGGPGAPAVLNRYDSSTTQIRFVKVTDASGALCADASLPISKASSREMLASGDRNLVMHKFTVDRTADEASTSQSIYALSMVIGTNDRTQLTSNDASCKPPAEGEGNENYCSVNQFDIIARAGNRAGGQ